MIEAVDQLNARLGQSGVQLAVRQGVHTGLVVVGRSAAVRGRNSWRSVKPPTSPPACKGSPRPMRW